MTLDQLQHYTHAQLQAWDEVTASAHLIIVACQCGLHIDHTVQISLQPAQQVACDNPSSNSCMLWSVGLSSMLHSDPAIRPDSLVLNSKAVMEVDATAGTRCARVRSGAPIPHTRYLLQGLLVHHWLAVTMPSMQAAALQHASAVCRLNKQPIVTWYLSFYVVHAMQVMQLEPWLQRASNRSGTNARVVAAASQSSGQPTPSPS